MVSILMRPIWVTQFRSGVGCGFLIYVSQQAVTPAVSWEASTVCLLPGSMIYGCGWGCIFYYTVGLAPEWSRFFYFMLIVTLLNQARPPPPSSRARPAGAVMSGHSAAGTGVETDLIALG